MTVQWCSRVGSWVPILTTATILAGCDSLVPGGEPQELSVRVGAVGASEIAVVTSTDFVFVENPGCEQGQCEPSLRVLQADTAVASVPFDRTYAFTPTLRYYVEVYPTGGAPATLDMRVKVDGKDWFDDTRELLPVGDDGEQETLVFTYQYTEPRLR